MTSVIDASVAAQWFVNEPGSAAARPLLDEADLLAPDFLLVETFQVVWKRWRRREANLDQLNDVIPRLRLIVAVLVPVGDLIEEAARIARDSRHSIYDCFYVVLARRSGATLISADDGQIELARRLRVASRRP
jgi:predicted nucleic acid-binding protein